MKRMVLLAAVIGALALVGWFVSEARRREPVRLEPLPEGRLELPEKAADKAPEEQAPAEKPPESAAVVQQPPVQRASEPEATWTLRGTVVSTNSAEPNAKVEIWRRREPESEFAAVTSAAGMFEIELPQKELPIGTAAWARVRDEAGQLRFEGALRLEPQVVITLSDNVRWRGTVDCSWPRTTEELSVALHEPAARAAKAGRRVGSTLADGIGYFELDGILLGRPDVLIAELQLRVEQGVVAFGTYAVSRAELESPAGARIPFDIARLRLAVRNDLGQAVSDVTVRVHAVGQASATLEREQRTDAEGLAEFTVGFGTIEYDVVAPGFAPVWSSVEVADGEVEHEVRLKPLELEDRLFGTVLLETGAAAEGALIVARAPGLPERALAAAQTRSGRDGTFELALPRGSDFEVTATLGTDLKTGPWLATVGDQPLVLTLEHLHRLVVRVDANALPPDVRAGHFEYVAIERRSGSLVQGTDLFAPFTIPGLVPGEWDVYVLAEGLDGCGTATVALGELQMLGYSASEVVVPLQKAHWVDALVIDHQRTPFAGTWAVAHGDWPAKVAAILGLGQCDAAGRLRSFCDSRAARLELYAFPDEAPLEARVRTDEFAEIVLK
ncbi:MAG: hypothetical protein NTV21_16945 [Planctomycetota bacterium]|nr:hypothetical protein [Planctomycetota bacterium]